MSDNSVQHLDLDSDDFLDAPKALRDYAKKLKAANDELATQVKSYSDQAASAALGSTLTGFKNPERVKRDLLADKINPLDSKALGDWLAANGDDYARADGTSDSSATDDSEVTAHQQIQAAGSFKQPANMSKLEAALAEITPEMTGAQVSEVYRKHGV